MNKNQEHTLNIICIPIYKSIPEWCEIASFKQCIKILNKHQICIFTFTDLDISYYTNLLEKAKASFQIEYFNEKYFTNIQGYNRLMLSLEFYNRFKNFEYILIYQLDAWVFRDELDYWCQKGYDYIGAPWFEEYGSNENGNKIWASGNGGFSLRRISSFLDVHSYKKPLFKISELKAIYPKENTLIRELKRIIIIYLKGCGFKNTSNYYVKKISSNEDAFWSISLLRSVKSFKIPKVEEALKFSFEKSPSYLYELNNDKLPFGCHAWEKYEYVSFWKEFIH